jgi:hypothetical protein
MIQTSIVIKNHFSDFLYLLSNVSDYRQRPQYEVQELLMAVICMFLFKRGSRNSMDNTMSKGIFSINISQIFKCDFPDLDTSDKLLRTLNPNELESIKQELIKLLITKKILYKFRVLKLYYLVAIDGTGIQRFSKEPYPGCPYKTSKNGVKTWTMFVLEAKIVCCNGFSFSILTEWIKNPVDKDFNKQDCELKAFIRLVKKLKKTFPKLPIIIAADGLYPNNTVFDICSKNNWLYIFTFKDGNLKTVWEEIESLKKINGSQTKEIKETKALFSISKNYTFINDLEYKKHKINFIETSENKKYVKNEPDEKNYFAHITNIKLNNQNCSEISDAGRMRWKIENEGFNEQKNGGYNLKHKFSRNSFNATQNYYQCLQIAHMINQLSYKARKITETIKGNDTVKSIMESTIAFIMWVDIDKNAIENSLNAKTQFRY